MRRAAGAHLPVGLPTKAFGTYAFGTPALLDVGGFARWYIFERAVQLAIAAHVEVKIASRAHY